MIIDMHTHVFPDNISKKAMDSLTAHASKSGLLPYTDGTLSSLIDSMDEAKIDLSVVLPVLTSVNQFESVNSFASYLNRSQKRVLSFGGIHPCDDDIQGHLKRIKDMGFKGIKLHPDYQDTFFDDQRYYSILFTCFELGLKVVTHSGRDPGFDTVHCTPKMGKHVLDRLKRDTGSDDPFVMFAHLGGSQMYDDVEKYLVKEPCFFDLSHAFEFCDRDQMIRIIRSHGPDRILFATDSPWRDQKRYVCLLNDSELSDNEKKLILYDNAKRFLGL